MCSFCVSSESSSFSFSLSWLRSRSSSSSRFSEPKLAACSCICCTCCLYLRNSSSRSFGLIAANAGQVVAGRLGKQAAQLVQIGVDVFGVHEKLFCLFDFVQFNLFLVTVVGQLGPFVLDVLKTLVDFVAPVVVLLDELEAVLFNFGVLDVLVGVYFVLNHLGLEAGLLVELDGRAPVDVLVGHAKLLHFFVHPDLLFGDVFDELPEVERLVQLGQFGLAQVDGVSERALQLVHSVRDHGRVREYAQILALVGRVLVADLFDERVRFLVDARQLFAGKRDVRVDDFVSLDQVFDRDQMGAVVVQREEFVQVGQVVFDLLHFLEDFLQRVARLELEAPVLDQVEQVVPEHEDISFASVYLVYFVIALLFQHFGYVDYVAHAVLERAYVCLNGLLFLECRFH
ncbi:hypothetical protein BpHYR1_020403 [Brachionus plicatilis]|uniref:Uncharacterized protein n=1 Tax=Brachionus plicatilis TaxID=10195 RepID=A0A3M7R6K3_BRAPC|nr:hypothetical protein BpHYR1_020403 [Brachionus plicatilis]